MRPLDGYDVVVEDRGVDAVVLEPPHPGMKPTLVLRPHVSFGAAVSAVCAVVPSASVAEARALVRHHLPGVVDLDFDQLLRDNNAPEADPVRRWPRRVSPWVWAGLWVLVLASVVVVVLLRHLIRLEHEVTHLRDEVHNHRHLDGVPGRGDGTPGGRVVRRTP